MQPFHARRFAAGVTPVMVLATRSLLPHGGGAVAIVIAGIVVAGIAAIVAVERRANLLGWVLGAFLVTVVLCSVVLYAVS